MPRQLLQIHASPRREDSGSRLAARYFAEALDAAGPRWDRVVRDLAVTPVPQLDDALVEAIRTHPEQARDDQRPHTALSDALIAELVAADAIAISTPMYNWNMPAALKAWLDQVMRVGKTFGYRDGGVGGLLAPKPCVVIVSRGGLYDTPDRAAVDFLTPYLTRVMAVMGLTPSFVNIDGSLMGTAVSDPRRAEAHAALDALALAWQAAP